jgi:hypothetical protein
VPLKQKSMALHDAEDAFVVSPRFAFCHQHFVDQGGDPPVAIGGPLADQPMNQRQELLVGANAIGAADAPYR